MRRRLPPLVVLFLVLGVLAGLFAAGKRWRAEVRNRRVEISVEWAEISELSQITQIPAADILKRFKAQGVSALILAEDTLGTLEQNGDIHTDLSSPSEGSPHLVVTAVSETVWSRIERGLQIRGISPLPNASSRPFDGHQTTEFHVLQGIAKTMHNPRVPLRYADLRSLGVGLPPEGIQAAQDAGLAIAGRIANFPGVTAKSVGQSLRDLKAQGVSTVIFSGEEVLGWRGLEKETAALLRTENDLAGFSDAPAPLSLKFGAVEFSKQKGDAKISGMLKGDYVRVHSIQTAEMGQLDEIEVIERFVRAARERNIRFCYVRLMPFTGDDPIGDNAAYLGKIANGMAKGTVITGGGLAFGKARPFEQTGVGTAIFVVLSLGVAAGIVAMLASIAPLSLSPLPRLLTACAVVCLLLAFFGETGRRVLALFAGIAFPAWACFAVYPRNLTEHSEQPLASSIVGAFRKILFASAITLIGILHVIGLLATRPFMVQANQYLGIKAQHAVPILLVGLVAIAGGIAHPFEPWADFRKRVKTRLQSAFREPAQFGTLLAGLVILTAFVLLVARTGNDAGVGVSGFELKFRALLDRILPVRPRTKEFLVGHPAFVLGLAWWLRGRKKWAIPTFVIGSVGQVSFLNTFCHIHSPLIVSAWRGGLGLLIGALLGAGVFLLVELFLPSPTNQQTGH